ncbi:MAG: YceI family protein [Burkholderiales bacterium]|nr:YceI family protein [Burkholderiales bacterium]
MLKPQSVAWLIVGLLLVGCAGAPTTATGPVQPAPASELATAYAALQSAGGRVFALNPGRSDVRIHAFRAGRAAAMGHNHALTAPQFEGYFHRAAEAPAAMRFDLAFRLDQLALDDPQVRATLGGGFASELSADAITSTRQNMLGANYFQAQQFPWVRIRSLQIVGEAPKFAAQVAVELHGQTRELWVPLTVTGWPDRLQVTGSLVLRQTDFGVQPLSVLGGLLVVEDAVVVDFTLQGDEHR